MVMAWSCPFSDFDFEKFYYSLAAPTSIGPGVTVMYKPLKYSFMLGNAEATDYGSPAQALNVNVIQRANAVATAAGMVDSDVGTPGQITTQPQDPALGAAGQIPAGTAILIGGIGVVVSRAQIVARAAVAEPVEVDSEDYFEAVAAADDQLAGIQACFDAAMFTVSDSKNLRATATGHECVSWGSSTVAAYGPPVTTTDGVISSCLYSGQVMQKDRGWCRFPPTYFDGGGPTSLWGPAASQGAIVVNAYLPRATPWPIREDTRFRVDVMLPALIATQGSGNPLLCDPRTGMPVGNNGVWVPPRGIVTPPNYGGR